MTVYKGIRTIQQLDRLVKKYIDVYKRVLWLGQWTIDYEIKTYIPPSDNTADGGAVGAETWCDWRYMTADLDFSYNVLCDMSDDKIKRIVLHEMLHIVVNEMQEKEMKHEERVVTSLEHIFTYLLKDKEVKKR